MNRTLKTILAAIVRSTAALVVLAMVLVAFVLGWGLRGGTPGDAPVAAVGSDDEVQWYTCSMHPQIRLTDSGAKCPICHMDLIPVTGGDDGGGERALTMTPAAMKLAEIETAPVVRDFPVREVRMFGTVDYDETKLASIAAWFPGRLERLYVDYIGVQVNEGEHLAEIYSPELNLTQTELRQALAAVARAKGGVADDAAAARLQAVREKLRLWGLTGAQIENLETSKDAVERLTIHAPISGVVIEKNAIDGTYVQTGDSIYTVADLTRLWVRLEAYESQLPWIRFGQAVEFTTDSLPGTVFQGRITFIEPTIQPSTRTVRVRMNVDNSDRRLKPGMFVRALARSTIAGAGQVVDRSLAGKWISPMHPEIVKDGPGTCDVCGMPLVPIEDYGAIVDGEGTLPPLVIPATAPLVTGRRAVVYVRDPDEERPTFEAREITLGPRAGDRYIVTEGLEEGEIVVVHGAFKIDSSMQIAARPSMMSAPEDQATSHPEPVPNLPREFLVSLDAVYSAYFDVQEALAGDDAAGLARTVAALQDTIGAIDGRNLGPSAAGRWETVAARLTADARADLDDIAAVRASFEAWSLAIIDMEKAFGHAGAGEHYVTFCPMAFDGRGAPWLARSPEVSNPYFGAAMLRCGTVQQTHSPREGGRP